MTEHMETIANHHNVCHGLSCQNYALITNQLPLMTGERGSELCGGGGGVGGWGCLERPVPHMVSEIKTLCKRSLVVKTLTYSWHFINGLCLLPGTGRRPVDWCQKKMSVRGLQTN